MSVYSELRSALVAHWAIMKEESKRTTAEFIDYYTRLTALIQPFKLMTICDFFSVSGEWNDCNPGTCNCNSWGVGICNETSRPEKAWWRQIEIGRYKTAEVLGWTACEFEDYRRNMKIYKQTKTNHETKLHYYRNHGVIEFYDHDENGHTYSLRVFTPYLMKSFSISVNVIDEAAQCFLRSRGFAEYYPLMLGDVPE